MTLSLLIEICILVVTGGFIAYYVVQSKKAGKEIPWEKIRPILTETFIRVQKLNQADKMGYQAVEDYAVLMVREQILLADFLAKEERALISDDLIRSIIGPRLKEIHDALKGQ